MIDIHVLGIRYVSAQHGTIYRAGDGLCSTVVGTPEFIAPEVLTQGHYDFKADVWSLGCASVEVTRNYVVK